MVFKCCETRKQAKIEKRGQIEIEKYSYITQDERYSLPIKLTRTSENVLFQLDVIKKLSDDN